MSVKFCSLILFVLATPLTSADIYRCQAEDGTWQFTDRPFTDREFTDREFTDRECTDGAAQKVKLTPLVSVEQQEPGGLSEAELQALIILDEKMAAWRASEIKQRKQVARQIRKNNKIKQRNCVLAARRLDELQEKRSRGYRLSEIAALDQETRKLERIRRTNCRP
jgi:hypothetical protein